jgi:hypothetical protein
VVTAWPGLSSAILAATAAMGYSCLTNTEAKEGDKLNIKEVRLEMDNAEIVSDRLSREGKIVVCKDGIYVTFSKDIRNKISICVAGSGYSEEQLRRVGEKLSHRIIQEYVYQKIKASLSQAQGLAVEESVDEDSSIHVKVRLWE